MRQFGAQGEREKKLQTDKTKWIKRGEVQSGRTEKKNKETKKAKESKKQRARRRETEGGWKIKK